MADNRIQKNSSDHSTHSWDEAQLAITDSEMAQQAAANRAVEAANAAAKRRPSTKTMSNSLDSGDFGGNNFNVIPAAPTPKPRAMRKGK